jgi:DNA adenine methylase
MTTLKAPFPYMGGKSRVAREVWRRFGDVPNYVEPFAGSLAVLLGRPSFEGNRIETVNDIDGHLANFWRAVTAAPDEVAVYADWPVSELDLHSRGDWLYYRPDARAWVERLRADPDYYDAKSAGWWVWFTSCWIGALPAIPENGANGEAVYGQGGGPDGVYERRPHLGNAGKGVARQRPHLGSGGQGNGVHGVARQVPFLGGSFSPNQGVALIVGGGNRRAFLIAYMRQLAARLERVRVCCGDWSRVTGPSVTWRHGKTGVFLDPPYSHAERDKQLYSYDNDVSAAVREWAIANGDNPQMRIALCGYDTEHGGHMPDGWHAHAWKAAGGYGSQANGRGRVNAGREVVWFSPYCINPMDTLPLFANGKERTR